MELSEDIKANLIGKLIKVKDNEYDKETDSLKPVDIIVKIINFMGDGNTALVEHVATYSEELFEGCGIKLEFKFVEKLLLTLSSNVVSRTASRTLIDTNTKIFGEALHKAYMELNKTQKIIYVYRHQCPINKAIFNNTILIGITKDIKDVVDIIEKDKEEFLKNGPEFDGRPYRFTYSYTDGVIAYVYPGKEAK